MRQIIVPLICFLLTWTALSQNNPTTPAQWISTVPGDFDTPGDWGTGLTPSGLNDQAQFPSTTANTVPVTVTKNHNIYGFICDMVDAPPIVGSITITANLTAQVITIDGSSIFNCAKGCNITMYNATSTMTVTNTYGAPTINITGSVGFNIMVGTSDSTINVLAGGWVSKISGAGNINVWGTVGAISMTGDSIVNVYASGVVSTTISLSGTTALNVWGTANAIVINSYSNTINVWGNVTTWIQGNGYDGTVTIYSGAIVGKVDPTSDTHIMPGASCDIYSSSSNSMVFFEYISSTQNTHNINNVNCVDGGTFSIANNTVVNIIQTWNTSTGGSTTIAATSSFGVGTVLNFNAGSQVWWFYVIITDKISVNNMGSISVSGNTVDEGFWLRDSTILYNTGTIWPEGSMQIDPAAVFHNGVKGIVSSSNNDSNTWDSSCYFYGQYSTDPVSGDFVFPTMVNDGWINCIHSTFSEIIVTCNGNVSSSHMVLSGYSSGQTYSQAYFTFTTTAIIEQPINLEGGGTVFFDGNHNINSISTDDSDYLINCNGNITVWGSVNFGVGGIDGYVYWYNTNNPNWWTTFSGAVTVSGGYFNYWFGSYMFTGTFTISGDAYIYFNNCTSQYSGDIYFTDSGRWTASSASIIYTVTSSASDSTGSGSMSYYLTGGSTLYLQGTVTTQNVDLYFYADSTSIVYNQGDLDLLSIYVDGTDTSATPPQIGYFYNIGTLRSITIQFGTANIGMCANSAATTGVITIVSNSGTTTYWDGSIYLNGVWDMQGWFQIEVPLNFDITSLDSSAYYIVYYQNPPQEWNFSDELYDYVETGGLGVAGTVHYCKNDASATNGNSVGYIYVYDVTAPITTCDPPSSTTNPLCSQNGVPNMKATNPSGSPGTSSTTGASSTGASSTGASSTGASSTGASSTGASSTGASSTGASSTGASSTGASSTGSSSTSGKTSTSTTSTGSVAAPSSAATLSISLVASLFISLFLVGMF